MKIHILGPSGSGKSYLGRKLSTITGIPVTDLDDLFWNNTLSDYEHRRSPQERDLLLQSILSNDHWIIEGVYYKWLSRRVGHAKNSPIPDFKTTYMPVYPVLSAYRGTREKP